jgi:hypothetical protein
MRPYERHVACLLSGILAGLGLFAAIECHHQTTSTQERIIVHVVGAVEAKDVVVSQGATVDDVLANSIVNERADVSELDGSRRVSNGEILVVPYEGTTTLYVTGAVAEPTVVVLQKNAKPRELLQFIQLQADADEAGFLRRKILKNGSIIEIKKKKPVCSRNKL